MVIDGNHGCKEIEGGLSHYAPLDAQADAALVSSYLSWVDRLAPSPQTG